jgi:hypothetical protein
MLCFVRAEMADMVESSPRRAVHNSNEIKRLEKNYFDRLGHSETKTIKICGHELNALALYYKNYVSSRRLGIEAMTCGEIENYFDDIAAAMDNLLSCIRDPPMAIHHIYNSYEHGHASWSMDGCKRSSDVNNVIMQLWHDGNAACWFLPKKSITGGEENGSNNIGSIPEHRLDELIHLARLMRRLSKIYQELKNQRGSLDGDKNAPYDEKDALVFNLAELFKKKARPVLHVIDIATLIHEWATGDPNPQQARFKASYKMWKNRT